MEKPKRKLPRMRGFDYSQEAVYFVTICSHENKHIFGDVSKIGDNNVFFPSRIGELVKENFFRLPERFPEFTLIHFSLLPNHLHFLTMKEITDHSNVGRQQFFGQSTKGHSWHILPGIFSGTSTGSDNPDLFVLSMCCNRSQYTQIPFVWPPLCLRKGACG